MTNPVRLTINNEEYVLASSIKQQEAVKKDGMEYVLVRTYSAGVHIGYLKKHKGFEVVLLEAKRIHYWDGAASLSELAQRGTSKPENCRIPIEVSKITLTQAIEIIPMTQKAIDSISEVPVWSC